MLYRGKLGEKGVVFIVVNMRVRKNFVSWVVREKEIGIKLRKRGREYFGIGFS